MLFAKTLREKEMVATKEPAAVKTPRAGESMGRKKAGETESQPTKPVRMHLDVAEMVEMLAPIFGKGVPEFVSDLLRPILQKKHQEGVRLLQGKHLGQVQPEKQ